MKRLMMMSMGFGVLLLAAQQGHAAARAPVAAREHRLVEHLHQVLRAAARLYRAHVRAVVGL